MGTIQTSTGGGNTTVNTTTVWDRIVKIEENIGVSNGESIKDQIAGVESQLAQSMTKTSKINDGTPLKVGGLSETGSPEAGVGVKGSFVVDSPDGEITLINSYQGIYKWKSNVLSLRHTYPNGSAAMRFLRASDGAEVGAVGYQNPGSNGAWYADNMVVLAASMPYIDGPNPELLPPCKLGLSQEGAYGGVIQSRARFLADTDWSMKFMTPIGETILSMPPVGNVIGVGTDVYNWDTGLQVVQIGGNSGIVANKIRGSVNYLNLTLNVYNDVDHTSDTYVSNGAASVYEQIDGEHHFKISPVGVADSAITWTTVLSIANNGVVGVGSPNIKPWGTTNSAIQIGGNTTLIGNKTASALGWAALALNVYGDTSDKYISNGKASVLSQYDGEHEFKVASSGAADNPITWKVPLKVRNDGAIEILDGVTAPTTSVSGKAIIYIDSADGDLKIRFADGVVKTVVLDS